MKNNTKQPRTSRTEQDRKVAAAAAVPTEATQVRETSEAPATLANAPLHKARLGRLNLTVWMREDKNGTVRFSVNLSRSYKTEEGYRETSSLDQGDLANAITLLSEAQAVLPPVLSQPQA